MWLLSVTKTWWLMSGIEVFVTLTGGYTVETLTSLKLLQVDISLTKKLLVITVLNLLYILPLQQITQSQKPFSRIMIK